MRKGDWLWSCLCADVPSLVTAITDGEYERHSNYLGPVNTIPWLENQTRITSSAVVRVIPLISLTTAHLVDTADLNAR